MSKPQMSVLTRKALADVTRRKGRSLFAIAGIFISILGLTAVNQATDLIGGSFFYSTDASAVPNISFVVAASSLPAQITGAIRQLPDVAKFQLRTTYNTRWKDASYPDGGWPILEINAYTDPGAVQLEDFQLLNGRLPRGPGEIVLDESDRAVKAVEAGGTIRVDASNGQEVTLKVVGTVRTRGILVWHSLAKAIGYMTPTGLEALTPFSVNEPVVNDVPAGIQILVQTRDPNTPEQTHDKIKGLLTGANLKVVDSRWNYTTFNADNQLHVTGLLTFIRLLTWLVLVLVCALIFNTITTLLAEQVSVIGTMKALGGTRWRIIRSYLLTVGIYSGVGTGLGLGIGLVSGYLLASALAATVHYGVGNLEISAGVGPFGLPFWVVGISLAAGLLMPLLSALWPLWTGTRITVREAIAAYGVRVGGSPTGRVLAHKISWGWVPQTVWLGLRSLWRKPTRTLVTLVALTLASTVFTAIEFTNNSVGASVDHQYNLFHGDARLDLASPNQTVPSQPVIDGLSVLPNVETAEAIDPVIITIDRRELLLMGLNARTTLYTPQLVSGRWLESDDQNSLVINDYAATRLGLQAGQQVSIQSELNPGQVETWPIVGIVHETYQVSAQANLQGRQGLAFTTLANLNINLRHLPADAANWVWVQTYDHSPEALKQLETQTLTLFTQLGLKDADFRDWQAVQNQQTGGILLIVYLLFNVVAMLVGLVGLLSLSHTLAASVLERRVEIGILRALGASGRRLGVVFCTEGLAMGAIAWGLGTVLGLPFGVLLLNILSDYFGPLEMVFNPLLTALTLLFTLGATLLASYGPALGAAHLRLHEALRYE